MCEAYFTQSIMKRAREKGVLDLRVRNLRDWAIDAHRSVDDAPYGGGAGMVMKVEVICRAVEDLRRSCSRVVLLSPQGSRLNYPSAKRLSREKHLILLSGHYEGVDERVRRLVTDEEISIGDYVLSNGTLASMILLDVVARFIPGVVGDRRSVEEDSFSRGILDYPHYTRPRVFRDLEVPAVLLSGDHEKIRRWRRREALKKTWERRPELLSGAALSDSDRRALEEITRSVEEGRRKKDEIA